MITCLKCLENLPYVMYFVPNFQISPFYENKNDKSQTCTFLEKNILNCFILQKKKILIKINIKVNLSV